MELEEIYKRITPPKDNPYDIKLTNIVLGLNLGTTVSLERIANELPYGEYEPESFPGLVYRISEPKATALVFTSGMVILSGINNIEDAVKAAKKMTEDFKSIGIELPKEPEIEIVNLVASADIKAMLDLNKIVYELGDCEYEPEQFPGLIYRMDDPNVVILIFNTGRVIVTGSKDIRIAAKAVEELRKRLEKIGAIIREK